MKQQTKVELQQERDRLREENTILSHAVNILARGAQPNAIETVSEKDGGKYAYRAYAVTAPHGGILLVTYYFSGQSPLTDAYYLERYARKPELPYWDLEHRVAIERLQSKARSLQQAMVDNKKLAGA
jgi:hypothetical protein